MTDVLSILVNASRPYNPFEVEIGGQKFKLLARRPSHAESAVIGKVWTDTYEESIKRLDATEDSAAIHRNLQRQSNDKLASYIAKADRLDFVGEAQILCGDKPADHPEVTAKVDEMVVERENDLKNADRDELLRLAMDRRTNIQSLIEANSASLKSSLKFCVYVEEGKHLVETDDQIDLLTEDAIEKIVSAANKALEVPKEADPLASQDSPQ